MEKDLALSGGSLSPSPSSLVLVLLVFNLYNDQVRIKEAGIWVEAAEEPGEMEGSTTKAKSPVETVGKDKH